MIIKIWQNNNDVKDVQYKTQGSSGIDLSSVDNHIIPVGYSILVKTGIHVAIPTGYEGQIRPRSGLALKHGITVLNAPGTIDSDYREEVGVILINHGKCGFELKKGDRIAQLVICKVEHCEIEKVESKEALGETDRKGGFGSTGV